MGKVLAKTDEMREALTKKYRAVTIDERKVTLRKWPYRAGLELTAKLTESIKKLAAGGPTGGLQALLKLDMIEFAAKFSDLVAESVTLSLDIERSNFESREERAAWVEELGMSEIVELFTYVAEMNFRPLAEKIGELKRKYAGLIPQARPPTSSPSSSPPDTMPSSS